MSHFRCIAVAATRVPHVHAVPVLPRCIASRGTRFRLVWFARHLGHRAIHGVCIAALAFALPWGCASDVSVRFQQHIDFLASDALEGRGVGTKGIEQAADYIASQFANLGLTPAGDSGGYFQTFPMVLKRKLTDATALTFSGDTTGRTVERDYVPLGYSSTDAFDGAVVFCGYGIDSDDKKEHDFAHLDLKAKVALIMFGEPAAWANADGYPTPNAMVRNKVYNAKDRGAAAVLFVNSAPTEGESDRLTPFQGEGADAYGIPAFHVSREMVDAALKRGGLGTLTDLQQRLDSGSFVSAELAHVTAKGAAGFENASAPTRNVSALLRGNGPHADEVVVIGAHYDHLGVHVPMTRKFKGGKLVKEESAPQIHNGADDNASGVSGLVEIARAFKERGNPPARTILFVAFTAEESGLHGSKYFVEHSPVERSKIVAMLNMDMIGRMSPGVSSVEVFGATSGTGVNEILESSARRVGLTVKPTSDTGGRSDHAVFIRSEIPAMHFFTGSHADYHQPTDDAHKINAKGGAKVAELVFRVADGIASMAERPGFQAQQASEMEKRAASGGTPTYRVVMGISPGYGEDGKPGMAVEAVTAQGPADIAGLKGGDRIVRMNGKPIANVYDYMASTRGNQPGDVIEVVVQRNGKEIAFQVKLASAR